MEFSRRGFLGLLLAGTAGLALPKDALWMPSQALSLPPLTPEAIVGLRQATFAIARELAALVDGRVDPTTKGIVGDSGMINQLSVALSNYPETLDHYGLDAERFIKPIAHSFAERIKGFKSDRFGILKSPHGVEHSVVVTGRGVSVRGISMWDHGFDVTRVRFDVLCGRA